MGIKTPNYIEINQLNNCDKTNSTFLQRKNHHFNYINDINHNHINNINSASSIHEHFTQALSNYDPMIKDDQFENYILTNLYNSFKYINNNNDNNINNNTNIYGCRNCKTHLSTTYNIISKDYRGVTGNAYLMSSVTNVQEGDYELRTMITGDYLVCDIFCQMCKNIVGWKYINAERSDQRYKEGKFILELKTITVVE